MCTSKPTIAPPPPPIAPPAVLEQGAPKSKTTNKTKSKRTGLSAYKLPTAAKSTTNQLGGIPKKMGTG